MNVLQVHRFNGLLARYLTITNIEGFFFIQFFSVSHLLLSVCVALHFGLETMNNT